MRAGYRGTFVISVGQTETDGIASAPPSAVAIGSVWSWWGEAVRVDGPASVLALDLSADQADLARRAARSAARLLGPGRVRRLRRDRAEEDAGEGAWTGAGFTVTDGLALYRLMPPDPEGRLLSISGALPPRRTDLSVVAVDPGRRLRDEDRSGTLTGFVPGTCIDTPDGARAVEEIRAGDRVSTCDSGPQEVLWTGARRLSGARLHAMPQECPVRIRAGALGDGLPVADLTVAPGHRVLIAGDHARELFGEDEVLIAARDLVDGVRILTSGGLREATYLQLMTARHEVILANGLGAETLHPALAGGATPGAADPRCDAGFARRHLTAPEVAILRHGSRRPARPGLPGSVAPASPRIIRNG